MTCDLVTNYNDKKKRQTTYYLCNKLAMNTYNVFEKGSIDSNNFIFGAEDLSVYNNYPIIFKNYFSNRRPLDCQVPLYYQPNCKLTQSFF